VVIDVPPQPLKSFLEELVIPPPTPHRWMSRSLAFIRTVLLAMTLFHFRDDLADAVDENVLIVNRGQPTTLGVILMLLPLCARNESWCLPSLKGKMGCSMLAISSFGTNTSQTKVNFIPQVQCGTFLRIPTYNLLILLYLMGFGAVLRNTRLHLLFKLLPSAGCCCGISRCAERRIKSLVYVSFTNIACG